MCFISSLLLGLSCLSLDRIKINWLKKPSLLKCHLMYVGQDLLYWIVFSAILHLKPENCCFVFTFSLYLRDKYTLQTDNKGQQYMACLSEIFLTASQVMCTRMFLNSSIWRNPVNLPSTQAPILYWQKTQPLRQNVHRCIFKGRSSSHKWMGQLSSQQRAHFLNTLSNIPGKVQHFFSLLKYWTRIKA